MNASFITLIRRHVPANELF